MEEPVLNAHNKEEYPPMHTAEHILNATMVRLFGCPRSRNAHIERKKSKCDYLLPAAPSAQQVADIEAAVNAVISRNLPVTIEFVPRAEATGTSASYRTTCRKRSASSGWGTTTPAPASALTFPTPPR